MSNRPSRQRSASAKVRQASAAGQGGNTTWLWVGLVVLIVVVGVVAVLISRSSDSGSEGGGPSPSGGTVVPSGDLEYGQVEVEGAALPDAPGSSNPGPDQGVGDTIPTLTGQTFDGSTVTIAPDGTPKVILVLAHWCPHCQAEVPRIQAWLDANGMPDDVEVVSVATANSSTQPNFPAGDWLREEGWSVPTMVDDREDRAGQALGVSGFPFFLVVDADGKVVERTSGEISIETWEALLADARSGQASLGAGAAGDASTAS